MFEFFSKIIKNVIKPVKDTFKPAKQKIKNVRNTIKRALGIDKVSDTLKPTKEYRKKIDEILDFTQRIQNRPDEPLKSPNEPIKRKHMAGTQRWVRELYQDTSNETKKRTRDFKKNISKMKIPFDITNRIKDMDNATFYALNRILDLDDLILALYLAHKNGSSTLEQQAFLNEQVENIVDLIDNRKHYIQQLYD